MTTLILAIVTVVFVFGGAIYIDRQEKRERHPRSKHKSVNNLKNSDIAKLTSLNPNARRVGNIGIEKENT